MADRLKALALQKAAARKKEAALSAEKAPPKRDSEEHIFKVPAQKRTRKANDVSFDAAHDSDTSSIEPQDLVRPFVYKASLKLATEEGEARKRARSVNIADRPAAIHSETLDNKPVAGTVHATDFDFGADRSPPMLGMQDAIFQLETEHGGQENAPYKEELAAVACETKKALGVVPGNANRKLANMAVETFQEQQHRPASVADAKAIKSIMVKSKAQAEKAKKKSKWESTLDDDAATRIAGDKVMDMASRVRNRIESRSAEEHEQRKASRSIVSQPKMEIDREAGRDEQRVVDSVEVKLSHTGQTLSAQSTTPAPGTEQRTRVEKEIQELEDREVVVSAETRDAKLATCVPPALIVQGRDLDTAHSTGALIHGDGRTVQTAIDFALAPLIDKSQSSANLITAAVERIYEELRRSVTTFYEFYDTAAEDSEFKKNPLPYTRLFEQRVHSQIEEMFPHDQEKRADLRKFLKNLFIGMPPTERKKKLMEKLSEPCDESDVVEEREALVDAIVFGSKPVAATQDDIHESAKASATQWQKDAETLALQAQVRDISDEQLALQMSYDVDPEEHILLRMIREHASNDVLYRTSEEAPITLQRDNETIYEGHHNSVMPEAQKMSALLLASNSYLDTLRMEETSKIHAAKIRVDELIEEATARSLTTTEEQELSTLRTAIREADAAARAAYHRYIIERCGHPDAAAAVEALYKRQALVLEKVSRSHAVNFMREPMGEKFGERACVNETHCICNTLWKSLGFANDGDRNRHGFVCREFLLPSELARYRLEGERALPARRKPCYFCELYQTSFMFIQRKEMRNNGGETLEILQQFETLFDVPGEYDASACNIATVLNHRSYGIIAGFPLFNSRNYKYNFCSVTNPETNEVVKLQQLEEKQDILFH